jgi:hypothetical protein
MLLDIMKQDHPRITEDYLNVLIDESDAAVTKIGEKTTVVQLVLPSGFAITEHSSCVDPANYDEALACSSARTRPRRRPRRPGRSARRPRRPRSVGGDLGR